jgi:hypothetical protein
MSRTYKCTKGKSKKLKPYFYQRVMYSWETERSQEIDYNDGLDKEYALNLKKGTFNQGVPKNFRKMLKKSENARVRNYLYNCKKDEDYCNENGLPIFREDAAWLWY